LRKLSTRKVNIIALKVVLKVIKPSKAVVIMAVAVEKC
jgi:hypothetical protein